MLKILTYWLFFVTGSFFYVYAETLPVQTFMTKSNLKVWLVEDRTSPVVSLVFIFPKTHLSSPATPVALLLRNVLNEGAGILTPLEMQRFSKETPSQGTLEFGYTLNKLTIKTTKEGLPSTLGLWARIFSTPQFERAAIDHSKTLALTNLSSLKEDLDFLSFSNLLKAIFPKAYIITDLQNSADIIKNAKPSDLEKENKQQFLRSSPQIIAVGDINKKELSSLLDSTFGLLPLFPPPPPSLSSSPVFKGQEISIKKKVSQSAVAFGQPGMSPLNKDYPKYLLLQNIISGRFFDELREKRGYIYSIEFYEFHHQNLDLLNGNYFCECSHASQVAKFIRLEWQKLKEFGVTQRELSDAKLYFKRANVLSLTSSEAVAQEYARYLSLGLGPNAAESLRQETEKVTLEEMNAFVHRFLVPDLLTFSLIEPLQKIKH